MPKLDARSLFGTAAARWNSLKPNQRVAALAIGGLLVAALLFLGVRLRSPQEYAPLFTRLEPQDAGEVIAALDEKKIPYKVSEDKGAILVPRDAVYKTRMVLAAEGLPKGGSVGFEIMDKPNFAATDFERKMSYLRGLQGELSRTISQLSGVEAARVHIVIPQPSLFIEKEKPATSAVFLKLKPGAELAQEQVKGIVHLVSRSVEGLKPENVTIIDSSGRVLSANLEEDGPGAGAIARLETERRFQKQLEDNLTRLLESVFGAKNVVTTVSAQLSFDEKTVSTNLFQPITNDEGIARSVKELEERFKGEGSPVGGVPGMSSNVEGAGNIPSYQVSGSSGPSEYERREVTRNFEVNQVQEHTVIAPGAVQRLSVAVVVNKQLSAEQQQAIEKTVAAAIGYDPERKDQITVIGEPFDTSLAKRLEEQLAADASARRAALIRNYALAGAACLLLILVGAIALRRLRRPLAAPPEIPAPLPEQAAIEVSEEEREKKRIRAEVERLAKVHPEKVADLVRAWLTEG